MRIQLLAVMLVAGLAAMTPAQIIENPQNPPTERPPQAGRGERREGGFWRMGPPPNPMFTAIDADGDGVITKVELRKAIAALKKLDADGDGNITLAEVSPPSPFSDPAQFVDRVIADNDKNGDGKLSKDEVPERLQRMLENADQNGDGEITREEVTAAMQSMRERFRGGPGGPGGLGDGRFSRGPEGGPRGPGDRGADSNQIIGQWMQFDRNGDGRLSANEVPPQMGAMLRGGDQNGDGMIDPAELQAIVARMGGAARAVGAGGDPNTFRDPNRRNRSRPDNQNN